MAWNDTDLSRAAALAGAVIVVCAFGSGAYTYGLLSDQESGTISITADFEPTTTPGSPGQNVVATTSCEEITLGNEGDGAVFVQIEGVKSSRIEKVRPDRETSVSVSAGEYTLTARNGKGRFGKTRAGNRPPWTVNGMENASLSVDNCATTKANSDDIEANGSTGIGSSSVSGTDEKNTTTVETTVSRNETVRETTGSTDETPATATTVTTNETTTANTTTVASETTTATETPETTTANRTANETTTTTPTPTTTTENES